MDEIFDIERLGYWDIGVLGYWGIGVLGYFEIVILGYWVAEYHNIPISQYQIFNWHK